MVFNHCFVKNDILFYCYMLNKFVKFFLFVLGIKPKSMMSDVDNFCIYNCLPQSRYLNQSPNLVLKFKRLILSARIDKSVTKTQKEIK